MEKMNNKVASKVLVTFDSMKYPNTGLFHFGKSLGKALITENDSQFSLSYYVDTNAEEHFESPELIPRTKLHKLWFAQYKAFKLIHFSDQYCRLNARRFAGKKVMTIHDLNQLHEENISIAKVKKYMARMNDYINMCDRIVAISNFVAKDILTHFPQTANKVSVIYNGADKPFVADGYAPVYIPKKSFLFTIGILSAKKNFHVLPALLVGNNHELVIAGIITPYVDYIIAEAKKHGVADRVKILGPVTDDDKAWYYKNCDAFIFPSIAEGFGLPVIEAMHFGKPVFLSPLTSLPEIAGDAAYYFKDFDPEAMQKVLFNGLQHFYKNDMAAKVMAHAVKYNWGTTARQYLQVYNDVLTNN